MAMRPGPAVGHMRLVAVSGTGKTCRYWELQPAQWGLQHFVHTVLEDLMFRTGAGLW